MGERSSACFVLKFAPQGGEGEKREGVQISKQSFGTFDIRNNSTPVFNISRCIKIAREISYKTREMLTDGGKDHRLPNLIQSRDLIQNIAQCHLSVRPGPMSAGRTEWKGGRAVLRFIIKVEGGSLDSDQRAKSADCVAAATSVVGLESAALGFGRS